MIDIRQIKDQADAFRKSKQFAEAIPLYEQLLAGFADQCNEWVKWGYASCLRKMGRSQEALEICRQLYKTHPDFAQAKNLYGWCIYDLEIKKVKPGAQIDENLAFKAANAIIKITDHENFSPYEQTVFQILRYLKKKPAYPADKILEWVDKLDVEKLSVEPDSFTDGDGKDREQASPKETWYALRTKSLERLQRYEECIETCQEALQAIPKFHYDDDVWFKRRIAISKANLGNVSEAISELKDILRQRKEWFIQHSLAELMYQEQDFDASMDYAIEAALGHGDVEFKWELFALLGELLEAKSKPELARSHILLAARVREEQGWKIEAKLQDKLQQYSVDLSNAPTRDELMKELKAFWKSVKHAGQPRFEGAIERMNVEKELGNILAANGASYFFRFKSFKGSRKKLQVGLQVQFFVEKTFDKVKQRDSEQATEIEEIR